MHVGVTRPQGAIVRYCNCMMRQCRGGGMRLFPGSCWALLLLVIALSGEAFAACCVTYTPVHMYVPPPTHVVIVPHTTYVRPVTQAHTHAANNTLTSNASSSTPPAVQAKRTPHPIIQPVVVANEATPSSTRCKQQQAGKGCKKDEEQTSWATVRRWLQLDKH